MGEERVSLQTKAGEVREKRSRERAGIDQNWGLTMTKERGLIGKDPIRVPPWGPCPSPCGAGASVDVEEEVAPAEQVTGKPLAPSAMTAWLPPSPIAATTSV